MSQKNYRMACLEKFGLADCNCVDKPISARLTVQDQQEVANSTVQELYHGMAGTDSAVSCILRRGLVRILRSLFLNCLDSS
jgi:hypothetical protein